jgi:hypothetical protein
MKISNRLLLGFVIKAQKTRNSVAFVLILWNNN